MYNYDMQKLTKEEQSVLDKIASKSKMDCWFYISENEDGSHCIFDCEEDEFYDLCDGILMLDSGITSLDDYDLTEDEKTTYINLMYQIKIFKNKKMPYERLLTLMHNAIVLLEDDYGAVMDTDLEEELGITREEYDEIMGGNDE